MRIGRNGAISREFRTLLSVGAVRELTDGQLLERFSTGRGEVAESAFEALVDRPQGPGPGATGRFPKVGDLLP